MYGLENESRPAPGFLSEGCHECGGGKNEILQSRNMKALCSGCVDIPAHKLNSRNFGSQSK